MFPGFSKAIEKMYEGNALPLGSKMNWISGDSVAFARRTANLLQQLAAINAEIMSLRQINMLQLLERLATTTFENVELLGMDRKGAKKRDSPQGRKDEANYGEFMCFNRFLRSTG
jgi:hypothetical protein